MVLPVYLDEDVIDGKNVRYSQKQEDDILVHIDNTGVERRIKKSNTHIEEKHKYVNKKDIIGALNSINEISPHKDGTSRVVAKCSNDYFLVFEANNEIVTAFKPVDRRTGKSNLDYYFKKYTIQEEREIIKWNKENLISKFITMMTGG